MKCFSSILSVCFLFFVLPHNWNHNNQFLIMQILHCHAAGQRNKFSHVNYVFGLFRSATQFQIYNCIFIGRNTYYVPNWGQAGACFNSDFSIFLQIDFKVTFFNFSVNFLSFRLHNLLHIWPISLWNVFMFVLLTLDWFGI